MQPRMIMHPYRADLNGQDLLSFTDPRGVPIFVEFADLVQREGEGYIDYVWQWKDDPQRLEPKESYVKGLRPGAGSLAPAFISTMSIRKLRASNKA